MKKQHVFLFACLLALCLGLTACGGSSSSSSAASSGSTSSDSSASAASASSASASAASSSAAASSASTAASSASAAAASSSASAASASSSAASASAATSEISYDVDGFFRETYEENGAVYFDTAMEVVNTGDTTIIFDGVTLGATRGDGQIIGTARGNYLSPNYIAPGKSAFVYPTNPIKLPEGSSVNDTFKTGSALNFKTTDKTVTEYPTNVDTYYDDGGLPTIGGTVTNNTNVASGEVTVVVSYYDNDGNLLGVGEDMISNIAPGESMRFRLLSSDIQRHCSWALIAKNVVTATSLN